MSGYVKNTWVNQDVERPKTYEVTTNADGSITLTDSFGLVTELGTPVNADNMNHIEDGLTRVSITEYDNTFTYSEDDWVTGIVDGEKTICRSKTDNNTGNALNNDTYWEVLKLGGGGSGYQLFDIVMKDHVLSYEETLGLAPLGTYVYKEAIAGTRYGYPDFYQKCVDEYQGLNNTTDTVDSVTVTINANGHKFYDIADKATFDNIFGITGECWYYGIDTTNERIFLPRSTRFKNGTTSDVGEYQEAGLPDVYINTRLSKENGTPVGNIASGTTDLENVYWQWRASDTSSIYGASDTVEYSSTKLIPYMVVGNQSTWSGMTDVVNQGMTILEQVNAGLATKVDLDGSNATFPHIIDTYVNGTSGYNVYSNGYCEQWGQTGIIADYATATVALLKTYKDEDYNIAQATYLAGAGDDTNYNDNVALRKLTKTSSSFQLYNRGATDGGRYVDWKTSGYLAQGEY